MPAPTMAMVAFLACSTLSVPVLLSIEATPSNQAPSASKSFKSGCCRFRQATWIIQAESAAEALRQPLPSMMGT
ncbi:hypothetical protein F5883DRAFT_553245 [Diaporthe sp. PMI_573]|nr:hypothetical protein F5883DRAFT_553245 [Diaporthaceae sp. PMI_573]